MNKITGSDFAALEGRVVTEAHARYCRENGHAAHTVNGTDMGRCPRCGDLTEVAESVRPTPGEVAAMAATITDAELAEAYPNLPNRYTAHHLGKYRRALAEDRLMGRRP